MKITEKDSSSVSILSYLIPKKDIYFLPPCINGNLAADEIAFILRPPLLVLRPQTARRLLRYLILEPLKFGESQIMFPHTYPFEHNAMKGQIHFRFWISNIGVYTYYLDISGWYSGTRMKNIRIKIVSTNSLIIRIYSNPDKLIKP